MTWDKTAYYVLHGRHVVCQWCGRPRSPSRCCTKIHWRQYITSTHDLCFIRSSFFYLLLNVVYSNFFCLFIALYTISPLRICARFLRSNRCSRHMFFVLPSRRDSMYQQCYVNDTNHLLIQRIDILTSLN